MIPEFRSDGYLPNGLHLAGESEVTFRFGSATRKRRRLIIRLRSWIELARHVKARRFLVDDSFVTAKTDPQDVDAVVWLPDDFHEQVERGEDAPLELEQMLLTSRPEEIFAAEDKGDWDEWVRFFSRTREADDRQKGLVEIQL